MNETVKADIIGGMQELVHLAGTNSAAKGFHEDWPTVFESQEANNREYQLAITEKLALIHEEISEALGEIRSGHAAGKVYYRGDGLVWDSQKYDTDGVGRIPMRKPEGFGIELADAVIRIADLAYLTGVDLGAAIIEKAEYNATRPRKHGRQF